MAFEIVFCIFFGTIDIQSLPMTEMTVKIRNTECTVVTKRCFDCLAHSARSVEYFVEVLGFQWFRVIQHVFYGIHSSFEISGFLAAANRWLVSSE